MHESARSLRPSWIIFAWMVAAALTSLILVVLDVIGVVSMASSAQGLWVSIAVTLGFLLGGLFLGTRVVAAPILHGLAMGAVTVVVFFAVNLFLGEPSGATGWEALRSVSTATLLFLQTAAAIVGARAGVRWMRKRS